MRVWGTPHRKILILDDFISPIFWSGASGRHEKDEQLLEDTFVTAPFSRTASAHYNNCKHIQMIINMRFPKRTCAKQTLLRLRGKSQGLHVTSITVIRVSDNLYTTQL